MATRESNMELARITAMLFVLLLHADFESLGWPPYESGISQQLPSLFKLFIGSMTFVCVDLFVLISGWFGMKPTLKKGINLLCTTLFYSLLIFAVFVIVQGKEVISLGTVKNALLLNKGYWFIKCYLFLMVISPILNKFVDNSSKKQFISVLLALFAFQCYFGWSDATYDYHQGYSSLLFIFLYLLARYVRKYQIESCDGARKYLLIYFGITVVMTMVTYTASRFDIMPYPMVRLTFNYLNPFVIVSALSLLLFFYNFKFSSKLVNWVSSSALAVYLIHANEMIFPLYKKTVYGLSQGSFPIISILCFVIIIFACSVLIDKLRECIFQSVKARNIDK